MMRISIAGLVLFFAFLVAGCGGGGSSGGGGGNDAGGGGGGSGSSSPDPMLILSEWDYPTRENHRSFSFISDPATGDFVGDEYLVREGSLPVLVGGFSRLDGIAVRLRLNDEGLPSEFSAEDGSRITLTDYGVDSVTARFFMPDGTLVATEQVALDPSALSAIRQLYLGAGIVAPLSSQISVAQERTLRNTGAAVASLGINAVGCAVSAKAAVATVAILSPWAKASCTSAALSFGAIVAGPGSTASVLATEANQALCVFLDPFSCLALVVDAMGQEPESVQIVVEMHGKGRGSVTSRPVGLDCSCQNCSCAQRFVLNGDVIRLEAKGGPGSAFFGWEGACMGFSPMCELRATQDLTARANFVTLEVSHLLSIGKSGSGSGTVSSNPSGINCGSTCSASFPNNQSVTLSASPSSGATFAGWSGACAGSSTTCTLTMSQAQSVTASFNREPATSPVPQGVVAQGGDRTVTLTWNPVAGASHYNVYYATESGIRPGNYRDFQNGRRAGLVQSGVSIGDLTNGTTHYFVVTAVVSGVESDPSAQVNTTPRVSGGSTFSGFKRTASDYDYRGDLGGACVSEFGPSYRQADWNDVVAYHSTGWSMTQFFSDAELGSRGNSASVTRNGESDYSSSRGYFITRHDNELPSGYLAHDNIDNHLVSLGSWHGSRPVLCYESPDTPSPTTGSRLNDGLVAWFPLDNGNANDASVNGNDGRIAGALPEPNGRFGGALKFTGAGEIVNTDIDLSSKPAFTIAMWVKRDGALSSGDGITGTVGTSNSGKQGFDIAIRDGNVQFNLAEGNRSLMALHGPAPASSGWHHYAWTFASGGVSRIYVDGMEVASKSNSPTNPGRHQQPFHFGRSYTSGGGRIIRHHVLVGAIDEVGVWSRQLEPAEIRSLLSGWQ